MAQILTCPRCPTVWQQIGNQTGHCAQCHRTFSSLRAFDDHQVILERGVRCLDPGTLRNAKTNVSLYCTRPDSQGAAVWGSTKTLHNTAMAAFAKVDA